MKKVSMWTLNGLPPRGPDYQRGGPNYPPPPPLGDQEVRLPPGGQIKRVITCCDDVSRCVTELCTRTRNRPKGIEQIERSDWRKLLLPYIKVFHRCPALSYRGTGVQPFPTGCPALLHIQHSLLNTYSTSPGVTPSQ